MKRPFSELSERFRGIIGAALGIRNSILRMAFHDLSNRKTTILGATPGAIPGIGGNPHERFLRAPRCGSGPNCRLEGTPHSQGNWRTLPSSRALPSPPSLSSPTLLALFAMLRDGRPGLGWGRRLTEVDREGPPSGTWGQTHIWGHTKGFH